MTIRQFFVCLLLGPIFVLFTVGSIAMSPLAFGIALLMGDSLEMAWEFTWEIITMPMGDMFMEAYRGYH